MRRNISKFFSVFAVAALDFCCVMPARAASRIPNDTYFEDLWFLQHVGAPDAWQYSLGMETVPVAIIDSGVDLDHPDLKDNIWRNMDEVAGDGIDNDGNGFIDDVFGWDFVDEDNDPNPSITGSYTLIGANHGTISAGLVAAKGDNGRGIVGMTWQVPIMALRALDSSGSGDPLAVARAVDYAVSNGAKVINLGFAGNANSARLDESIRRAYAQGVFVVAAAGNASEGGEAVNLDTDPLYPICFDRDSSENYVYGVAGTDRLDRKATFSNYGASCVDISAPGEHAIGTQLYVPGDDVFGMPYGGYYNGTSVAAPLVSGLVALMFSLDRNLTPKQVMNILTETSFNINPQNPEYFGKLGRGRIEAAKAVHMVADKGKEPTPVLTTASLAPSEGGNIVVTAPGPGRAPEIRMFTEDGLFIRSFSAYAGGFMGGVSMSVGNFDGSHGNSIVTGALAGGGPHVRVFDFNTRPIGGFFAYDANFRGGVEVDAADTDGNGIDEIVTGAGPGGGPHVRVFDKRGIPVAGFFAFEQSYRGGIDVAAGDLNGDGRAEIAVAPGKGSAEVRVFDSAGKSLSSLVPFGAEYRNGMTVEITDMNGDGGEEIVVRGTLKNGGETAAVFDGSGKLLGDMLSVTSFGASLGSGAVAGSGTGVVSTWGTLRGGEPVVTVTNPQKKTSLSFSAYEQKFRGGVSVRVIGK